LPRLARWVNEYLRLPRVGGAKQIQRRDTGDQLHHGGRIHRRGGTVREQWQRRRRIGIDYVKTNRIARDARPSKHSLDFGWQGLRLQKRYEQQRNEKKELR
jgi:hypothetical protein